MPTNQEMWDAYKGAIGGNPVNFGGAASYIERKFSTPEGKKYAGYLRTKKRGGNPKRGKKRVPVNPLDVQTDAFLSGQTQPYQGLLNDVPGLAGEETAANARLTLGTDKALSGIGADVAAQYGALSRHIADSRNASVQNLAGQADWLKGVLGGDFVGSGATVADTTNAADVARDFGAAGYAGSSAIADLGRSRVANRLMNTEYNREAGLRWDQRKRGLTSGIAGINASRPYVRRQIQSQNLEDQLQRSANRLANLDFELRSKQADLDNKFRDKQLDQDLYLGELGASGAGSGSDDLDAEQRQTIKEIYAAWTQSRAGTPADKDGLGEVPGTIGSPRKSWGEAYQALVANGLSSEAAARKAVSWIPRPEWRKAKGGLVGVYNYFQKYGVKNPAPLMKIIYGPKWRKWYREATSGKGGSGGKGGNGANPPLITPGGPFDPNMPDDTFIRYG